MLSDIETTWTGRPVVSKFKVTTESNYDDVKDDDCDGNVHGNSCFIFPKIIKERMGF